MAIEVFNLLFSCRCLHRWWLYVFVESRNMLLQTFAAHTRLGTVGTFEGFFPSMLQDVRFKISVLGKRFRAVRTLKGPLASVAAYVSLEIIVCRKSLGAVWTLKIPFAGVSSDVLLQIVVGGKCLGTVRTVVVALA